MDTSKEVMLRKKLIDISGCSRLIAPLDLRRDCLPSCYHSLLRVIYTFLNDHELCSFLFDEMRLRYDSFLYSLLKNLIVTHFFRWSQKNFKGVFDHVVSLFLILNVTSVLGVFSTTS